MMMNAKRVIGAGVLGLGVLIGGGLFLASLTTIEQGHVGVVYNRNGGVETTTLGQGMHIVSPMKRVTEYPVALETVEFKDVQLATKDGKPLTISMSFNYMNDPAKVVDIFNTFKGAKPETIVDTFIRSRVKEAALSVTTQYTILEIFQNRETIKVDIAKRLTDDLKKYGFIVADFVLGTPVPDESTSKAIQAVVDAQQQLEALKIETEKAKQEALRKQEVAEGEAKAKLIQAQAEAKANQILSQSITEGLLKKMEMEARLKHGWIEIQGANTAVVDKK